MEFICICLLISPSPRPQTNLFFWASVLERVFFHGFKGFLVLFIQCRYKCSIWGPGCEEYVGISPPLGRLEQQATRSLSYKLCIPSQLTSEQLHWGTLLFVEDMLSIDIEEYCNYKDYWFLYSFVFIYIYVRIYLPSKSYLISSPVV